MFCKRLVDLLQTRKNQGLFGKGLSENKLELLKSLSFEIRDKVLPVRNSQENMVLSHENYAIFDQGCENNSQLDAIGHVNSQFRRVKKYFKIIRNLVVIDLDLIKILNLSYDGKLCPRVNLFYAVPGEGPTILRPER